MLRWPLALAAVLAVAFAVPVLALDDHDKEKDELRAKILKKVEERLKEENKRVIEEVKKILDEELAKMGEDEEAPPKKDPKKDPKLDPKADPHKHPKTDPKPEPKHDEPGYLGVYPEDLTESMRKLLKLGEGEGVLLVGLAEDGPAAKAGLQANDIVLAVDGDGVGTAEELREAVTKHKAGESVKLSVLRKKEKLDIKVKLAPRESVKPPADEGDEGDEGSEGDEGDEKDEKPVKKPKVVFEPRVEAPKFSDKTAEQLREEIRKFLDETLKAEKSEPAEAPRKNRSPKVIFPGGNFNISDGDGDEDDEEPAPAPKSGKELRELTKRFLKDLLDKMEKQDSEEGDEDEAAPFGFDEELQKMMEKLKSYRSEEFEKLKEQLKEQMGKLKDDEYLKKLLEGMNGEQLQEQLKKLLGGAKPDESDDEDLTKPEDEQDPAPKHDPAPKEEPKKAGRAWLGVSPEEVSPEMLKQLKIESGVLVRDVVAGSPAEEAGLKEGDILLAIDGTELTGPEDLQKAIAARKAGADVTLTILRKGKKLEKSATLTARKKISVELKPQAAPMLIGDPRGNKEPKKHGKKKAAKTAGPKAFDPAKLGLQFARQAGLRVAILDKNGKVILSQPMENMAELMKMAEQFGFEMPSGKGAPSAGKLFGKNGPSLKGLGEEAPRMLQLFLQKHGDKAGKPGKKSAKKHGKSESREDAEGCEECPLSRLFQGNGARGGEMRKHIEKAMKALRGGKGNFEMPEAFKKALQGHGKKLNKKFEFKVEPGEKHEFRFENEPKKKHGKAEPQKKHGKSGKKVERKEEKRLRIELKKDGSKKPALKLEGGKGRKDLDGILKQVEEALKQHGGKQMPGELKKEMDELRKELRKMMEKHKGAVLAA